LIIDFVLLLLAGGCIFFILNRKESDDTATELNENNEIQVESSKDSSGDNGNASEIDEEVQTWLSISYQEQQDTLERLALVNVKENQGIISFERMPAKEEAESSYNRTKESYDYYNDMISAAVTTAEMVEMTSTQVDFTDDCLNEIWRLIKYNTDEATFNKALEEQRQWLEDRDAKAKEASGEYDGGSFASVAYNDTYASMTMERCEKLLEYLK